MSELYLDFGGKDYYLDFDELDKFLFVDIGGKEVSETEERIMFSDSGEETGKEVTVKTSVNEKEINGVRYEMITGMIQVILDARDGDDGDDLLGAKIALEKAPLAYKLAFNTLMKYKIIKIVK